MSDGKNEKGRWNRLKERYQMVVMTDDTFEIRSARRFNLLGLIALLVAALVSGFVLISLLFVFTPAKQILPGQSGSNIKGELIELSLEFDTIANLIYPLTAKLNDVQSALGSGGSNILEEELPNGEVPVDIAEVPSVSVPPVFTPQPENGSKYSEKISPRLSGLQNILFFVPLAGATIVDTFNRSIGHYGLDMVNNNENAPVMAVLSGTIISSTWDYETGHTISIQHDNNLTSIYKHNSVLLKKVGNFVSKGDAIAIVGNSGHLSSGPHLHLELWYNGFPVNPLNYLNIK